MHPYDEVTWERRDVVQTNWKTGETIFEQKGVEFPDFWSANASTIVTTKYFRGALGTDVREWSLKQLLDRVVLTYAKAGKDHGYFATDADAEVFEHELTWMLLHQVFSFNSPVWFNVGTRRAAAGLAPASSSPSTTRWTRSSTGTRRRGSSSRAAPAPASTSPASAPRKELLSSGGTASGPVSFMRGADASAGTIKSGGATRRAAKMVVLDVDHPDIEEFIETKSARGEQDPGPARRRVRHGPRRPRHHQRAVPERQQLRPGQRRVHARRRERRVASACAPGRTARFSRRVDAKELFAKMAKAAWECADPGIQYDDTINDWHTTPESGRITASNPCSEYMHLDNSSCNLASLNLLKFLTPDGTFDAEQFVKAVELVITAMDISICFADFPTEAIGDTTRTFRQLGIGYANLGALLMAAGLGYDSDGGRALAASITSAHDRHGVPALRRARRRRRPVRGLRPQRRGAPPGHAQARRGQRRRPHGQPDRQGRAQGRHPRVGARHRIGEKNGWRNAQASVLAPTGTIGFMMDCDTTGIEPDFSLVKFKKLVGGGSMQIVNQTIPVALRKLGYAQETIEAIVEYIAEHGHVVDAPGLKPEHYEVFDCAMGTRAIKPMGHVRMMAACQPFLSGAISQDGQPAGDGDRRGDRRTSTSRAGSSA